MNQDSRSNIVSDSLQRVRNSPERERERRELWVQIQERHAAEWAQVGFLGRLRLRWRMAAEYRRGCCQIGPSDQALFGLNRSGTASRPLRVCA